MAGTRSPARGWRADAAGFLSACRGNSIQLPSRAVRRDANIIRRRRRKAIAATPETMSSSKRDRDVKRTLL